MKEWDIVMHGALPGRKGRPSGELSPFPKLLGKRPLSASKIDRILEDTDSEDILGAQGTRPPK